MQINISAHHMQSKKMNTNDIQAIYKAHFSKQMQREQVYNLQTINKVTTYALTDPPTLTDSLSPVVEIE